MAYANMRGNMPCWTKIYAIFWDRGRASFLEKKSTAQKHIQIFSMLRSGFFFRKRRSVMVPRFGFFFQDSRIRVKWISTALLKIKYCFENVYSHQPILTFLKLLTSFDLWMKLLDRFLQNLFSETFCFELHWAIRHIN